MAPTVKNHEHRDGKFQDQRARCVDRRDDEHVEKHDQRDADTANNGMPVWRGRHNAECNHQAKRGKYKNCHYATANWRRVRDSIDFRLLKLFRCQGTFFLRQTSATRGNLGLGRNRAIPFFLPMQLDHRGLTLRRHVCAQFGLQRLVCDCVDANILRSDDIGGVKSHHASDDGHWHYHKPEPLMTCCRAVALACQLGNGRGIFRSDHRIAKGVCSIKEGKHHTRQDCGLKQGAHGQNRRFPQIRQCIGTAGKICAFFLRGRIQIPGKGAEQYDNDRWRNDLAQRARRRDDTRGEFG